MAIKHKANKGWIGVATIVALGAAGVLGFAVANNLPYAGDTHNCTVQSKDRAANRNGGSDMRVYTSCGVFSVGDNVWRWHFDSADTYASIAEGKTYDFDAIGFRFGLISAFPNILNATEAH